MHTWYLYPGTEGTYLSFTPMQLPAVGLSTYIR